MKVLLSKKLFSVKRCLRNRNLNRQIAIFHDQLWIADSSLHLRHLYHKQNDKKILSMMSTSPIQFNPKSKQSSWVYLQEFKPVIELYKILMKNIPDYCISLYFNRTTKTLILKQICSMSQITESVIQKKILAQILKISQNLNILFLPECLTFNDVYLRFIQKLSNNNLLHFKFEINEDIFIKDDELMKSALQKLNSKMPILELSITTIDSLYNLTPYLQLINNVQALSLKFTPDNCNYTMTYAYPEHSFNEILDNISSFKKLIYLDLDFSDYPLNKMMSKKLSKTLIKLHDKYSLKSLKFSYSTDSKDSIKGQAINFTMKGLAQLFKLQELNLVITSKQSLENLADKLDLVEGQPIFPWIKFDQLQRLKIVIITANIISNKVIQGCLMSLNELKSLKKINIDLSQKDKSTYSRLNKVYLSISHISQLESLKAFLLMSPEFYDFIKNLPKMSRLSNLKLSFNDMKTTGLFQLGKALKNVVNLRKLSIKCGGKINCSNYNSFIEIISSPESCLPNNLETLNIFLSTQKKKIYQDESIIVNLTNLKKLKKLCKFKLGLEKFLLSRASLLKLTSEFRHHGSRFRSLKLSFNDCQVDHAFMQWQIDIIRDYFDKISLLKANQTHQSYSFSFIQKKLL